MNRRAFLLGTAATIVAAKLPAIASTELTVYGKSPGMLALVDLKFIESMSQRMTHTIIYGNDEWMPTQFTGFIPRYGK